MSRSKWGRAGSALAGAAVLLAYGAPTVAAQSTPKPVTVTLWYGLGGVLSTEFQALVNQFNDTHPGIKVVADYEGSYTGGGPEQQKLLASIEAHDPPDIAQLEVHSMPVFASVGALMPLTSYVDHSSGDKPSDFLQGMMVSTQYHGVTYGIPMNRSLPVIFYNKTMFHAAHISGPPNTWNQLYADAYALSHGQGSNKVYGFSPLDQWWFWEVYTWEEGQQILSPNLKSAVFATDKAALIFKMTVNLVKHGVAIVQSGSAGWGETTASFENGEVAMDEDSSASIGAVTQAVGHKFQWGVAMMPKAVRRAVPPGGANLVIMAGTPKKVANAAWTFIQWWSAPAQTMAWSEETGYLPIQKSLLKDSAYLKFLNQNPAEKTALQEVAYQEAPPESPEYLGVYGYAQDAMDAMYFSGTPVMQALKTAQQQADQLLQSGS